MYRDDNRSRYLSAAEIIPTPDVPLPSPSSPLVLPGQPNPLNKPGLIPLFQYMSNLYQQYIKNNVDIGYLKVSVNSAVGGMPIPDAKITISKPLGENLFLSQLVFTDAMGQTPQMPLPTRSTELSQTAEHPVPYTIWNIMAEAPGYNSVIVYDASVFPGVVTTQSFSLKPIEGNAAPQTEQIYATARRMGSLDRFRG